MALVLVSEEQRKRLSPEQFNEIQHNNWLLSTSLGNSEGDCTVTCEGAVEGLRLHQNIICKRSDYFRAAFKHGFAEDATNVLQLRDYVTMPYLQKILVFIYLSIPKAGYGLDVYGPMSDVVFYELMFELYRQSGYLMVTILAAMILVELRKRLRLSAQTVFLLQHSPADPVFVKTYEDTMKAVVFAYDNSNKYHHVYEPFRDELFRWIEMCYAVLSRARGDFYDYLDHALMLAVTILKKNHNIKTSDFIRPGPQARCMFCNSRVGHDDVIVGDHTQPQFGIVADRSGGVKYFCNRSGCLRMISVSRCFNGTHTCVGPICACGRRLA